ncbi:MAG: GNAT family N-acetyltransferase [Bacillus sp. (in: firmicutes)]
MDIGAAQRSDTDEITELDRKVIGDASRRILIEEAIKHGRCVIVKDNGAIAGFSIYDTHFLGYTFISLIVVSPSKRRQGHASRMLTYLVHCASTNKVFSSTNRSNRHMQKVFEASGFIKSGIVENIDEGDPEIIYFKPK